MLRHRYLFMVQEAPNARIGARIVHAPTLAGMGVEIDRAEMDRRTKNILR